MAVVADTSFLVDVARREAGAEDLLQRLHGNGELILVPTVVVAEYLAGSRDPRHDLQRLQDAGEVVPLTMADAREAGAYARRRFAEGTFPGWSDSLIAGTAVARGALNVVTSNPDHFEHLETLTY